MVRVDFRPPGWQGRRRGDLPGHRSHQEDLDLTGLEISEEELKAALAVSKDEVGR